MRLLFSTRPAYGHVYPLMPLALAARQAGHEVHFATTGAFLPKLRAWGFPVHDVGITFDAAIAEMLAGTPGDGMPKGDDGRPDLDAGARLFLEVLAPRAATDLAPVVAAVRPAVVVYEQFEFGAAVVAHAAGVPAVCHSISPRLPGAVIAEVGGARVERLWAGVGADPGGFDMFTGDVYIDVVPTVLQDPPFLPDPARLPVRPVPFSEPGAGVPDWVGRRGRPVIYLTLGTIVATDDVLRPAIEGLATLDADVLVALGSAAGAALGPQPANVFVETFVDQPAVLRRADLVVHHGGTGTILAALTYGTPQVLLPKGADQFLNGDAMARADLAPVLEPADVTPDTVASVAKIALTDDRPAVDSVRRELAERPGPAAALQELRARLG